MADSNKLSVRPFGMRDKIGYAFGDFGNDFTFILSSMFMMKFYTDIMGISAGIVGALMMLARFVDAFTDVTMGQIVDRTKPTKDGKFRPWIKRMCGPVAISSFLIYQAGFAGMSTGFKILWMFPTYLLWGSIFYTAINIPYGSMASAISPEAKDRAELSTFRSIGASLAGLVIGVVTPMFAYEVVDGVTVLSGSRTTIIAGVFSVLSIICYLLCFHLVRERVEVPQNTEKLDVVKMLKSIAANRALLGIIIAAIMLLVGQLGMSGMLPYVFPIFYNSADAQSVASLTGSLGVLLICAPLAVPLADKFGKKELSAVTALLGALLWIACLIVRPKNAVVYLVIYTLAMICIGFFNMVIWAMITDVIDSAEVKNGFREDGAIYSVYSFARKLGQAASSGMIGAVLTAIHYNEAVPKNPGAYPDVLDGIFKWSCLIPAAGLLLVALSLMFIYPLNKRSVEKNVAELARRRNEKNS